MSLTGVRRPLNRDTVPCFKNVKPAYGTEGTVTKDWQTARRSQGCSFAVFLVAVSTWNETCCVRLMSLIASYRSSRSRTRGWILVNPIPLLILALLAGVSFSTRVAAQNILISEFMAVNSSGKQDEDGDFSDWIELFNADKQDVSLAGWHLTDNLRDLAQWTFPEVVIRGRGFLLVYASGKDRRVPKAPLHTNFKLDGAGEYLALVRPDGTTLASQFSPAYPPQHTDVSYGRSMTLASEVLVPFESQARFFVPGDNQVQQSWMQTDFADAAWMGASLGLGYSRPTSETEEPPPQLADITQPGDRIIATSANSPSNEGVENAIDNNSLTKYLNFDKLNAGLTVTPSAGFTIVTGLKFTSANDAPERDPTSFILFGSSDGAPFTEIARGSVPNFTGRFTPGEVRFANTVAYNQYRLLFPTVRNANAAVAVQIAEIELLGAAGTGLPTYAELTKTAVESLLFNRNASIYVRIPFLIDQVQPWEQLALRMNYDDGFVAWLNGVEIARANAPGTLTFNANAVTNRPHATAEQAERFDVSAFTNLIHVGGNVLAIQGLNDRRDSPDFLLRAQLDNTEVNLGASAYFASPTPGAMNSAGSQDFAGPVQAQPGRGFFEAPISVSMSSSTPGATIRYTTDGTRPGPTNGIVYSSEVRMDRTTTLRAIALRDGWEPSPVATHTYLFLNDVVTQTQGSALAAGFPSSWNGQAADYGLDPRVVGPVGQDKYGGKYRQSLKADLQSVPSMSIVMDTDDLFGREGVYSNPLGNGEAWERPVSLELIDPHGREEFQIDAGIRIQGGAFRRFDLSLKKSFRVIFREKYGSSKLEFPLFGPGAVDEFNNIVLRANSNDAWPYFAGASLYIRDAFAMESARAMGIAASHTRFVHLYINGLYWGLYNPVERPDAAFAASYHGGDRDSWDAINQDSVPDGTADAWNRLLAQARKGFATTEAYQRVQGNNPDGTPNPNYENLLDVDNLIDYILLNIYVGNTDWPERNWWTGINRDEPHGFQFYPWDTETALGVTGLDVDRTGIAGAVAQPYAAMRANADFRLRFADHVLRHFSPGGAFYVNPSSPSWDPSHPENNQPAARLNALASQIDRAIVGESARWGDQLNRGPFTRDEHWLVERNNLLTSFLPKRSAIVLSQLRRVKLYPQIDPPVMNQRGGAVAPGFLLTMTAAKGKVYYTTDGTDPRPEGGIGTITSMTYIGPIKLVDLTTVKARAFDGVEWSALNEATFEVGTPSLTVTELHYHPGATTAAEKAAGFNDPDDFEFIELWNNGNVTYDLAKLRFVSGIEFDFGGSVVTQLASGKYVLVVKSRAAFERRYGPALPIAGEFSGQLNNAGERIELANAQNEKVLSFVYGTKSPWPEQADGDGPSLQVVDPNGDLNSAANWRASAVVGGSPGLPSAAAALELSISTDSQGQLHFSFSGRGGVGYTVYVSSSLNSGQWQVLAQGQSLPQDQMVNLNLERESAPGARFFRVSMP